MDEASVDEAESVLVAGVLLASTVEWRKARRVRAMDDIEKTISERGDLSYVVLNFLAEELGPLFRTGSTEAVNAFLHWYRKIRNTGNSEIQELFLWKFFPFLPSNARHAVVGQFNRDHATWELEQTKLAEHFRTNPYEIEFDPPEPSHRRWVTSKETVTKETSRERHPPLRFWPNPILIAITAISVVLSITGMASIVDGIVVWIDFVQHAIDLYRTDVRQPLESALRTVYPQGWPLPPSSIYDACVVLSCLYAGLSIMMRFGREEFLTLLTTFQHPTPGSLNASSVKDLRIVAFLRRIGQWLFGPVLVVSIFYGFFQITSQYKAMIEGFHINNLKLWIIAHGDSLVGFDSSIEEEKMLADYRWELKRKQLMLFRALMLYMATFVLFGIVLFINFQVQRRK